MTEQELMYALRSGVPILFHDQTVISGDTGKRYDRVLEIIHHWRGRQIVTSALILDRNGNATVRCLAKDLEFASNKEVQVDGRTVDR